jgi:hypothetical protein
MTLTIEQLEKLAEELHRVAEGIEQVLGKLPAEYEEMIYPADSLTARLARLLDVV